MAYGNIAAEFWEIQFITEFKLYENSKIERWWFYFLWLCLLVILHVLIMMILGLLMAILDLNNYIVFYVYYHVIYVYSLNITFLPVETRSSSEVTEENINRKCTQT